MIKIFKPRMSKNKRSYVLHSGLLRSSIFIWQAEITLSTECLPLESILIKTMTENWEGIERMCGLHENTIKTLPNLDKHCKWCWHCQSRIPTWNNGTESTLNRVYYLRIEILLDIDIFHKHRKILINEN